MSEQYLPIKESVGYINIKKALKKVFNANLDDIEIKKGNFENFGFGFVYRGYKVNMVLSSTGKNIQFEYGEGGMFDILVPNPHFPKDSFLEETFFYNVLADLEEAKRVKNVFGKNEKAVEYAMSVLKRNLELEAKIDSAKKK